MLSAVADAPAEVTGSDAPGLGEAAPHEWRVLGRLERTAIGTRLSDGVVKVGRREPAGCLLYGPYWQLPAGPYRLSFRCLSGTPRLPGEPVVGVEVIAMNRVQLAWRDLTATELHGGTGCLDFTVPQVLGLGAGDEARLEFRFFHMGNADLMITTVDLHSTEIEGTCPSPPRTWRMLGRLEKRAIGRRGSEGVAVRRGEPAGCMLDHGRPYLQLPAGHYCVDIRCDASNPRMPAQPALGVEIIARRRWQDGRWWSRNSIFGPSSSRRVQLAWRDFTSAELAAGSAACDFEVPQRLALEGGQDIVIGLRIFHLGNARLVIRAVDLRRMSAAQPGSLPLRHWRLFGRCAKGRIGAREGECAVVQHSEPPGCFLRSGRPWLQLPAGRYRLTFCCRSSPPRDVSKPALRVEAVARNRSFSIPARSRFIGAATPSMLQARREFTADEMASECASLDFEVPPQLSCESKDEVGIEFRFFHLGNADLAVGAVDLHEIGTGDLPAKLSPGSAVLRKTRVLIIGNCQAQTIYEALMRSGELNDRLDAVYHFVGLQKDLQDSGRAEVESSDVLLVQDIRDWETYPLREYVRDGTQIIKFPLLHLASLWPFDHYNGPGDREAYEREWPNLTFLYHDGLLARLRREIPDPEERLRAYRTLSVDGVINFTRLHDFERRRLETMDKQFGCEIGQYILEHFRKRRLFYTTNHPNGQIIGMLMKYLLRQLGMDQSYRLNSSLDHLRRLQVPVHPKVAQALGVTWANERTKYLYGGEEITWETYVRRYIDHYG
jgi:hypothetical protein